MDPFFVILLIGALVLGGFGALHYFLRNRSGVGGYRRQFPASGMAPAPKTRAGGTATDNSFLYTSPAIYGVSDGGNHGGTDCGTAHGGHDGGGCSDGGGGGGS
jgi:hypothetical protein